MTAVVLEKKNDPATRLRALVDRMSARVRRRFLAIIEDVRQRLKLPALEQMIRSGQTQEALDVIDRAALQLGAEVSSVVVLSGQSAATWLRANGVQVSFDQTNENTLRAVREAKLNLIRGFRQEQREVLRELLTLGAQQGLNPRVIARELRQSIGLTPRQTATVRRYRELLETRSSEALDRELRDRRFDTTVRASARGEVAIPKQRVDAMVDRYRQRWINYRAEVIGRTEALRAVHQGNEAMLAQAVEERAVESDTLVRRWNTALDGRVRDSHASMHRQERPYGETFVSGAGNRLRYPGDPQAPASETIQCRCVVSTQIKFV